MPFRRLHTAALTTVRGSRAVGHCFRFCFGSLATISVPHIGPPRQLGSTQPQELGLQSFPKVSGSKGIQVYVPLNTPATYDKTQSFAGKLAQHLEKQHPKLIVSEMAKTARKQRVFIDWSQNSDFKTTIGVYSVRANRPRPFVSLPVKWEELDKALSKHDASKLDFEAAAAVKRVERAGDLFAPLLALKQSLA